MPKLLIQEGGQQSLFELFDDEVSIGRGAANQVQVADGHASKHHAVIRKLQGRPKLVDLESKNGTRVNGEFRNQRWLEHGDVVTIGALTITFDGSDLVAAPPPMPVTVASAPAVSFSPQMAAAAAVSAPPPPPPAPAATRHGGRSRRPRDDDYDDEDRGGRVPARRSNNNMAVLMLALLGAVAVIAIMFLLLRGSGAGNAQVLATAKRMYYSQNRKEAAIRYLKDNGDPSNEDSYESVRDQLKEWESIESHRGEDTKETEATVEMKKIDRDRIEMWKNGITHEQMGQRLVKFLEDYKDTREAAQLEKSPYEPYSKLRVFLEEVRGKK